MKKYFLYLTMVIGMSACAGNKAYFSSTPPSEVTNIQLFEPLSFISSIEKGNQPLPNDSLSRVSSELWLTVARNHSPQLPFGNSIDPEEIEDEVLKEEIYQLFILADQAKRDLSRIDLPPNLVAAIDQTGERFAMISLTSGFTRRNGNYTGQVAKGLGIGILTLGMYAPIPIKANSSARIMILDNQLGEIAYYHSNLFPEWEPLEEKILHKHIQLLFKGYYW